MSEPRGVSVLERNVSTRRTFVKALALGAVTCTGGASPVFGQTARGDQAMRTIVSNGLGRIVILSFDRGEKLREGIRDKLKGLGIRNAVLLAQ